MDIEFVSIAELGRQLAAKVVSPVEVVRLVLDRIARIDPQIRSFITVASDAAIEAAHAYDRAVDWHRRRPSVAEAVDGQTAV